MTHAGQKCEGSLLAPSLLCVGIQFGFLKTEIVASG